MVVDIMTTCRIEVDISVELWVLVGDLIKLPAQITNRLCPDDCNNNGSCEAGVCNCNDGWMGASCDIAEWEPPQLTSIPNNVCDIRQQQCSYITVYGYNFVDSPRLLCNITQDGNVTTVPGKFIQTEEIRCPVSACSGVVRVAVSNNGAIFSTNLAYICFDSVCDNCNQTYCSRRDDVCRIGGQCFADGFVNPANAKEACMSQYSISEWTSIRAEKVEETRLTFLQKIKNILVTAGGNLTINGSLDLEYNVRNRLAITFNGTGSLSFGHITSPCLQDPDQCLLGFTITFSMRFTQLVENTVLLSTCGSQAAHTGLALLYSRQRLYAVVSTRSHQWTAYLALTNVVDYRTYDVTWSRQAGLAMYLEGTKVAVNVKGEARSQVLQTPSKCDLVVGEIRARTTIFVLELLHVTYSQKDIVDSLGITTGFPEVKKPTLTVDMVGDEVGFMCQFTRLTTFGVQYFLTYYSDHKVLSGPHDVINTTLVLTESLTYGSQISCEIQACYADSCNETLGKSVKSNIILIQLELLTTTQLVVYEGSTPGVVQVRSTVPTSLFCPFNKRNSCKVKILAGVRAAKELTCPDRRTITQAVLEWNGPATEAAFCGLTLETSAWQQVHTLFVKGVVDTLRDGDQQRTVQVYAVVTYDNITTPITFEVGHVPLLVKDRMDGAKCVSLNDPHIQSFDGRIFDNFEEGEFVFFWHHTMIYQVNVFYRSCRGAASCNCGVAVLFYNDVVVINKCPPKKDDDMDSYPMEVKLYRNGELSRGFRVNKFSDNKYAIFVPTGEAVYVQLETRTIVSGFINVWMVASSSAFNNTGGLCGTYDQDSSNDLTTKEGRVVSESGQSLKEFIRSWRVSEEDSLFDGYCQEVDATSESTVYCDCPYGSDGVCGAGLDVINCGKTDTAQQKVNGGNTIIDRVLAELQNAEGASQEKGEDITDLLIEETTESTPLKCRSTEPRVTFQFNATYIYEVNVTKFTEVEARQACESKLNASIAVNGCRDILDTQLSVYIGFCIRDYMMTGDKTWISVAEENIKQLCLVTVEYNISYWTVGTDGFPRLPPAVNLICPNDCSGNGLCIKGKCYCNENTTGGDCSLSTLLPPTLKSITGGPLCDLRLSTCNKIVIAGRNFVSGSNLTCIFTAVKKTNTSFETTNTTISVSATYVSSEKIRCSLPDNSSSYYVSVTNNRRSVSNEKLLRIVYHSLCEACTEKACTKRADICTMDGNCYESGYVNPFNASQVCRKSQWTIIKKTEIQVQRMTFVKIVGTMLQTPVWNFTVFGSPTLVPGPVGGLALLLNGLNQWLNLSRQTTDGCFWDLEKCDLGLTVSFRIRITELKEGSVFFTSGADVDSSYGLAMWYSGRRVYLRVSTSTREWTVFTTAFRLNAFVKIRFSWSIQTGLRLFLDDKLVAVTSVFLPRTRLGITRTDQFLIGKALSRDVFTRMELEGFEIAYCPVEILDSLDIVVSVPDFEEPPRLNVTAAADTDNVTLKCTFQPFTREGLLYYVAWSVNNVTFREETLTNGSFFSVVTEEQLLNVTYGDHIFCEVYACYQSNCQQTANSVRKSVSLIVQVTVSEKSLVVTEGENPVFLTISATLPPRILCRSPGASCSWQITTTFMTSTTDLRCADGRNIAQALLRWVDKNDTQESFCGATLTDANWLTGTRLAVLASTDTLKDRTQTRSLLVQAKLFVSGAFQRQVQIDTVQVEVKDKDETSECIIHGDPHVKTYDGRRYNNYKEGEMVLYKHKTDPYQVHVFLRRCKDFIASASCICAVAIRSGDDVIRLDKCGAGSGETNENRPIKISLFINGDLTRGTSILRLRGNNKYRILLPAGRYVTVETTDVMNGKYLNVYMRGSPSDVGRTEGLCGSLDGNMDNDITASVDDFNTFWRVKESELAVFGVLSRCQYYRSHGCGRTTLVRVHRRRAAVRSGRVQPVMCSCWSPAPLTRYRHHFGSFEDVITESSKSMLDQAASCSVPVRHQLLICCGYVANIYWNHS
ncbi:uncharacterized protein LOC112565098 isoform X1 [Pomacea canaliculata]|uniref:uncharacterized protein LOC112565098 isoform X1 n=1 Tax=Pomacea canaliculata TaxID=400727 RepID=UPI000D72813F|nr:uncharacterized protein LOC112565098 isoform X1 [Pomacea canaliculata]